ncbi:MAG: hypothetical protein HQ553_02155 [Chloroflexi bacterium]|nr:hypothetical protein [Chloroflexota bacterium]
MHSVVDQLFLELTEGKTDREARISIFEKIRDIPYAIVPRLISAENYLDILKIGKGSCTPKHLLLAALYEKLGLTVLLAVYPFKWADVEIEFPSRLKKQADSLPDDYHLACKVEIGGKLVLVDATVDLPLRILGLPVNRDWDGVIDMLMPVNPSGDEQLFHPSEAEYINNVFIDEAHLAFFDELNYWLVEVRKTLSCPE